MKKIVAGVVMAAVAGLAGSWVYWPTYITQQRVKLALNDPDSAKFEGIVFDRMTGIGCGYVNAKNRMGGYGGALHFVSLPDGHVQFEPQDVNSGTLQQQIDATSKQVAYLKFAVENCPEEQSKQM